MPPVSDLDRDRDCRVDPCELCQRRARGETCAPDCAGWWIGHAGELVPCEVCGLFGDDEEVAQEVYRLFRAHEFDCAREGWAIFDCGARGWEVEKDDEYGPDCGVHTDDRAIDLSREWFARVTSCRMEAR